MFLAAKYDWVKSRAPATYGGGSRHYTVGVHRVGEGVEVRFRYIDAGRENARVGTVAMSRELAAWLTDTIRRGFELQSVRHHHMAEREFDEQRPGEEPSEG